MASAELTAERAYKEGLGIAPTGFRGRPLIRGLGNKAFLKLEVLLTIDVQQSGKICPCRYSDF